MDTEHQAPSALRPAKERIIKMRKKAQNPGKPMETTLVGVKDDLKTELAPADTHMHVYVRVTLQDYAYFVVSLCLGGLIAAAYPFFGVTFPFVRVLYPPLLQAGSTVPEDEDRLKRLGQFAWFYLLLGVSMPMLAIALALFVPRSPDDTVLLARLALGGVVGGGLAFWLCYMLQRDLGVLQRAVARSQSGRD